MPTSNSLCLTRLPVEILLDIYHQLDLESILALSATHTSFLDLFTQRQASILLPVLAREFSPFDELLQVYTASRDDLHSSGQPYAPRRVVFRRQPEDTGFILAPRIETLPESAGDSRDGFTPVVKPRRVVPSAASTTKTIVLTDKDMKSLVKHCRLVRKWEEMFPQMRWFHEPENCRTLRPHEAERFRRALYRWWLYGFYFHGDFPRPRPGLPEPYVNDIRTSQMRYHSTSELLELMDLVEAMKDVVLHYLCPRLDPNQQHNTFDMPLIESVDRPQSLLTGWNDQGRWSRIVKTYSKLGPRELLYFFENIYSYPRNRLITEVQLQYPNFTHDQESLQIAIRCALDERSWLDNMPSLAEDSAGGIIDFDDERDAERLVFGGDASPDGSLPPGRRFTNSFSRYSPRGDDGSYLEEPQRQAWMDGRCASTRFYALAALGVFLCRDTCASRHQELVVLGEGRFDTSLAKGWLAGDLSCRSSGQPCVLLENGEDHPMNDADAPRGSTEGANDVDDDETASDDGSYEEDSDPEPQSLALSQLKRRGLLPTGCCYDDRMKLHMNADFSPNTHHPEDPRRIHEIFKAFKKMGLVYTGPASELPRIIRECPTRYMWRIPTRPATREEICLAHSPDHLAWVEKLDTYSTAELRELTKKYDQGRESLYVGSMSYPAALLSAGGAIETCKKVVTGQVKNAFAVIRPPGHHAEFDAPMGFCFFNNVPVAVRVCQQDYPELCRKVLILDWDVHHGNGVQNIFYQDPNVLYISLHVYQNGTFYPGQPPNPMTPDGGIQNCGSGPGLGKNVNIGWHDQGMGDGEYMAAFQKIVMPIAKEFNPDLVVVSAGFDAADGDELGGCFVSPGCYAHMTHMLMSLADGKVSVCLEGGYNLKAISVSAVAVARTLMGEPPPKMEIPKLNRDAAHMLGKVQAHQAPYWECMRPGIVNVPEVQGLNANRLHDVIRNAQRQVLQSKHNMVPLYVQREQLYKSFENQVLVTPNLHDARKILVIIHDPPRLLAQPDLIDTSLESHNSWVVDGVTDYIDWAVSRKFGVMDVNVPAYITHEEDSDAFIPGFNERALQEQIQSLICYLWDNYLQLYDADEIFLMGIGNAYLGVKVLLMNRDCKSRISGVVNFVTGNLRPVKSDADGDLSSWYKENSRVYVAGDHACWSDHELTRKVHKRRFGTVVRSPMLGLNNMMQNHAEEAQEWIMARVSGSSDGDTTEEDKTS
ncbi:hypothetical protein G7046_g1043 [Stylonectria norvegica]|nr:hypothetical protein G7046_g1043 [Stylonectria norvegica]